MSVGRRRRSASRLAVKSSTFAVVATKSLVNMVKICPKCGHKPMEPYAHDSKHELLWRCNKCGFKEGFL